MENSKGEKGAVEKERRSDRKFLPTSFFSQFLLCGTTHVKWAILSRGNPFAHIHLPHHDCMNKQKKMLCACITYDPAQTASPREPVQLHYSIIFYSFTCNFKCLERLKWQHKEKKLFKKITERNGTKSSLKAFSCTKSTQIMVSTAGKHLNSWSLNQGCITWGKCRTYRALGCPAGILTQFSKEKPRSMHFK